MRRQGQHYNQSGDAYEDQMRDAASQRLGPRPVGGNFQRREQGFSYEKVRDFANARDEEQWRSGRDGSSVSNPLDSYMLNEGQWDDLDNSTCQGQIAGVQYNLGSQANKHPTSQPRQEDMDTRYEDDSTPQGFEGLENKFLDDVMKLVREQKDAEDAEYARHKEKLDTINLQYQEQLTTLRANHASRRDALLQNESNERQQQYQQAMVDQYSKSNYYSMPSNNPHSYHQGPSASAATKYAHHQQQQLNTATTGSNRSRESYKYNQRGHFSAGPGGHHHQDTEPRHSFPGGRIYDNRGFY